ncbi:hypothetical protein BGZ92_007502, partial [Podila epicladia]
MSNKRPEATTREGPGSLKQAEVQTSVAKRVIQAPSVSNATARIDELEQRVCFVSLAMILGESDIIPVLV